MGVITEAIEKLLSEYIRDRGLVLWFDPERHYESILCGLNAGQQRVLTFDGSFYKLRLEAEPFLRGIESPKLLVYLTTSWEQAKEPLAELITLGVDLYPGAAGNRNTRLAVVSRKALKGRVADGVLADLDRQIEQGGLTLAELEDLALGDAATALPTTLTVHFGTPRVEDAALEFLAHPDRDQELMSRNGLSDFAKAIAGHYGIPVESSITCAELRKRLARQVLTCDLLKALGPETPEALKALLASTEPAVAARAADLAEEWRTRRDLAAAYSRLSEEIANSLHLDSIDFTDAALERASTFLPLEERLLRRVALKTIADPDVAVVAQHRQGGFWYEHDAELQAEWALVWQAGQLLKRASEIEKALNAREFSWAHLVENYCGAAKWCELDTLQRRVERQASSLEFALATPPAEVEQLVHAVRRRYHEVAGMLAEQFLRAWHREGFGLNGYCRQSEIYDRYVAASVFRGRIAYFLVDALRWELAQELLVLLGNEFELHTELAIGIAPSITDVGMAALLPSAASGLQIGGTSKLQVSLHGQVLKDRSDRIKYFKQRVGAPVFDLKLEDSRGFRRKLKDLNDSSALAIVTSREIDQSGEDETSGARDHMERVLTHLALAARKLAGQGFEKLVIAADHGYLFGEDLAESDKIDVPGGKTVLPHRRVWVGQGAAANDSYLLTEVARFGAASDFEMAVPWNIAGFRTAGPSAYFHGGLSPQEILLPVIVATPKNLGATQGARKLIWDVSVGSAKITARFFSVRIQARSQGLFTEPWPVVRVEVQSAGEVCAIPVSASYGFQEATGAVALRALENDQAVTEVNTVALMLTGKAPSRGTVTIHVLDAATLVELKKLENVEVSLAI